MLAEFAGPRVGVHQPVGVSCPSAYLGRAGISGSRATSRFVGAPVKEGKTVRTNAGCIRRHACSTSMERHANIAGRVEQQPACYLDRVSDIFTLVLIERNENSLPSRLPGATFFVTLQHKTHDGHNSE